MKWQTTCDECKTRIQIPERTRYRMQLPAGERQLAYGQPFYTQCGECKKVLAIQQNEDGELVSKPLTPIHARRKLFRHSNFFNFTSILLFLAGMGLMSAAILVPELPRADIVIYAAVGLILLGLYNFFSPGMPLEVAPEVESEGEETESEAQPELEERKT